MRRVAVRPKAAVPACLVALALAGCGAGDRGKDVAAVAQRFHAALEAGDGQAACDQLSQDTASKLEHQVHTLGWSQYIGTSDFWNKTLQNWQSEFLAIGSMAILAVYLRQRGSPESKPVGAPHDATGIEG